MLVPSLQFVIERPSTTTPSFSNGPVHHVYSKFVGVSSRQRSKRSPSERVEWSLATKESQTHHQQSQRPCQLKAAQIRSHLDFRDRLTIWIMLQYESIPFKQGMDVSGSHGISMLQQNSKFRNCVWHFDKSLRHHSAFWGYDKGHTQCGFVAQTKAEQPRPEPLQKLFELKLYPTWWNLIWKKTARLVREQ